MSGGKFDKRFGTIAVKMGFISQEQLLEALNAQIVESLKGMKHRLIGQILQAKNYLTLSQRKQMKCLWKWVFCEFHNFYYSNQAFTSNLSLIIFRVSIPPIRSCKPISTTTASGSSFSISRIRSSIFDT